MPYSMIKIDGGYQVVSPNHPKGHSLKPMTYKNAIAQMLIMKRASAEKEGSQYERYKKQREGGPE